MPFHFSLQSRPDTFGNTMYDIRSAIIPYVAAHGQRQAVIVHEPGDPPRCGFIDREGIALQCDLVHPPQRTEVPLVEIQQGHVRTCGNTPSPALSRHRSPSRETSRQPGSSPRYVPMRPRTTPPASSHQHPGRMSSRPSAVSGTAGIRHRQPERDRAGRPRTCRRLSAETDRFPVGHRRHP